MNVITLKQHRYKGKQKNVGDEYEFKGRAERCLAKALGWVIEVPKAAEAVKQMVAEQKAKFPMPIVDVAVVKEEKSKSGKFVVDAVLVEKPKRTYKRRDMVSDE
jgi:hypothetical protein